MNDGRLINIVSYFLILNNSLIRTRKGQNDLFKFTNVRLIGSSEKNKNSIEELPTNISQGIQIEFPREKVIILI